MSDNKEIKNENDEIKLNIDQNYKPNFEKRGKPNNIPLDDNVRFKKFDDN